MRGWRRKRIVLGVVLAVIVIGGAAVHAFWPRKEEPRTEVGVLMRVHAQVLDTFSGEEFGAVWDLLAAERRARIERSLEWAREHPDEDWGIGAEELRTMDARTFLEVCLGRYAEHTPEAWRDCIACLRSLRVDEVAFHGDSAWVGHELADWSCVTGARDGAPDMLDVGFSYVREDGAWRFLGLGPTSGLPFKTLGGKLEAFLPKIDWPELEEEIRIVVTVGPEGLAPEGADLLAARLEEWARHDFMSPVLLDLAPRVSWGSVVRATDACVRAGYWEIRFAAATTAGPGPGVRVNGVPVTEPFDPGVVDVAVVRRAMTIGDRRGQPVEVRLSCPNAATGKGVPWVFETTFTNLGAEEVRAFRMRNGDPGARLVLETYDPEAFEAVEPEFRFEPEPPPVRPVVEGDEDDATIFATSPYDRGARIILGPTEPVRTTGAARVVLRPGDRVTRLDVVPRRPGDWTAHAEVLDERGRWIRSDPVCLSTLGPERTPTTSKELREKALGSRGEAMVRLSATRAADAADAEGVLATLGQIARTSPEPSLRLLAALCAGRLREEEGRRLLREIVEGAEVEPALREAAARLLE